MNGLRSAWTLMLLVAATAHSEVPLPVDNLTQVIATRVGIVTDGAALHLRCCCAPVQVAIRPLAPTPDSPIAGEASRAARFVADLPVQRTAPLAATAERATADPIEAVLAMFAAFERRDAEGWVGAMAAGYRFDSNDSAFVAAHPAGFDRDDERSFVTHLFVGGGPAPDGRALPVAAEVRQALGPIEVEAHAIDARHVVARVVRLGLEVKLSDGSHFVLAGSDNVLELVLEQATWRVVAWHERIAGEPDALASAAPAGRPATAGVRAVGTADAATGPIPGRLGIRAVVARGSAGMTFELALPASGGRLDLYDVMGRRLVRRNLAGILAGTRHVTLPSDGVPAGVYWARVQQGGTVASARVVWIR